jgi:prevent-host-death family protein
MTKVPATDFKARCLELMDRVAARGESFVITKRGRPVARLVPLPRKAEDSLFGCLAGKAVISGDITSPATGAGAWETIREWDALEHGEKASSGGRRRGKAARSRSAR